MVETLPEVAPAVNVTLVAESLNVGPVTVRGAVPVWPA